MTDKAVFKDARKETWPSGLYKRKDSFKYRRNYCGKRILEVWGNIPEDEAIRKATRYNLDLEEGIAPDPNNSKSVTFESFARDVWLKKKATEVNNKSLSRYRAVIDNFLYYLENVKGISTPLLKSVTYEIGADYISYRAHTPLMPNGSRMFTRNFKDGASKMTLHYERGRLFQLYEEAIKRKIVDENPFTDVIAKKPKNHEVVSSHHPLTYNEEQALLKAAIEINKDKEHNGNPRFHDILFFLLRTGLRENEMRHLEWKDIDLGRNLINVKLKNVTEIRTLPIPDNLISDFKKRIKDKSPDDRVSIKDADLNSVGAILHIRDPRTLRNLQVRDIDLPHKRIVIQHSFKWKPKGTNGEVPMCSSVRKLLESLKGKNQSNFVFPHWDGGICRMKLLPLLKESQSRAGIAGRLRIHDLRHTLALRLRSKGVPLETIMGILRHANIKETLIYAPYHIEEGHSAMSRLDED